MPETDEFGRQEVLHAAFLLADAFERWIGEHEAVTSNPALAASAADLVERLNAFYQLCGTRFLYPEATGGRADAPD